MEMLLFKLLDEDAGAPKPIAGGSMISMTAIGRIDHTDILTLDRRVMDPLPDDEEETVEIMTLYLKYPLGGVPVTVKGRESEEGLYISRSDAEEVLALMANEAN